MLKSYLTTLPCTKFILIEDSLDNRGKQFLSFVISEHLNRNQSNKLHYFIFEGYCKKTKTEYGNKASLINFYDFVKNGLNWIKSETEPQDIEDIVSKSCNNNGVVIIDSLANFVLRYGISESYRILNTFKNNSGIAQIITVLHSDLLPNNEEYCNTAVYFRHLCTLNLSLQPGFLTNNKRIQYVYKKIGGKIIKDIEEYWFEEEKLFTEKIKKIDPKHVLEQSQTQKVNPENLSTFKIGLSEEEKKSRDNLVLPYTILPNSEHTENTKESKIIYNLDEVDDWDEEDPDDDLDI